MPAPLAVSVSPSSVLAEPWRPPRSPGWSCCAWVAPRAVRVCRSPGSLAGQAFTRSWALLSAGAAPEDLADAEAAAAVCAARLAGLDLTLTEVGLTAECEERGGTPAARPPQRSAAGRRDRAGTARLLVEPPENHAEHCLLVTVFGVLLAPCYDCPPGDAFVLGVGHHLHNCLLPDAGLPSDYATCSSCEMRWIRP